jgi:adenine-specific DNA-methyltransferase
MGLLKELFLCRTALEGISQHQAAEIKKHIIQQNVYGVDIERGAVDIARLRFWLSLIVDEETPQALPNLDFKIMQGNSLLEQYKGVDLSTMTEKKADNTGMLTFFDDMIDVYRKELRDMLIQYFDCTDHKEKQSLRTRIIDNVKQQLLEQHIKVDFGDLDLSGNEQFFLWHTWFHDVFSKGGFNIVIANPPYIGEKGHKEIFQPIKQEVSLKEFYIGKMDYFYFFFHLASNFLHDKGICTFITTNYYPTALGARKLRNDFARRTNILQLINFNEYKIFESALGQHNLITILEKSDLHNKKCKILNTSLKGFVCNGHIQSILDGSDKSVSVSRISQQLLFEGDEKYIRLYSENEGDNKLTAIFDKMMLGNKKLGDVANVNTGLFTACDKVFIDELDSIRHKFNTNKLEQSLLKPLYKNSDIHKYATSNKAHKVVIYHHEKATYSITEIPNIYAYLFEHKSKLQQRRDNSLKGALKRGRWDVMALPKTAIDFDGPKIVAPQRSKSNTFGYNEIPWYASADVYFITKPTDGYLLKYILGLLNSKLYYTWLYYKGKRKGDCLELYQKPLSEIPIIKASLQQQESIVAIIDHIISVKKTDILADTATLESEIDRLVYQLYGLSYDEVLIVDPNTPITKEEYEANNRRRKQ